MYERRALTLRLPPALHEKISDRAEKHALSVNEWIIKAVEYTLAAKDPQLTVRTEERYRL